MDFQRPTPIHLWKHIKTIDDWDDCLMAVYGGGLWESLGSSAESRVKLIAHYVRTILLAPKGIHDLHFFLYFTFLHQVSRFCGKLQRIGKFNKKISWWKANSILNLWKKNLKLLNELKCNVYPKIVWFFNLWCKFSVISFSNGNFLIILVRPT